MIKYLSVILLSSFFINISAGCIQDNTFNRWWLKYKNTVELSLFQMKEALIEEALSQAEADKKALVKLNNTLDQILSSF